MLVKIIKKKGVFILLLLCLSLTGVWLLFRQKSNLPGQSAPPTPFLLPSPSSERPSFPFSSPFSEQKQFFDRQVDQTHQLYPLIDWLPIDTDRYHLTYAKPGVLEVTIKNGAQEEIKKEVVDWIRSKGVDPSTHQIIFK